MSLAYSLTEENINNISSYKDTYIDNIVKFLPYKNAKTIVDFINKKKPFSFILLLLEIDVIKNSKIILNDEKFQNLYETLTSLIDNVKKYQKKSLKQKYLRISQDEIDIYKFIKIRYELIKDGFIIKENYEPSKTKSEIKNKLYDFLYNLSTTDLINIMLGAIYDNYSNQNADILEYGIVKKIIKNSYNIARENKNLISTKESFDIANEQTSKSYKRALDVLSK